MIYNNNNVYPSPELEFIKDHGGSFDIIEGCWGVDSLYFDMDEDEWTQITNETKYYCKWVGSMMCYDRYKRFYIRCKDDEYVQNLVSYLDRKSSPAGPRRAPLNNLKRATHSTHTTSPPPPSSP